ncbi:MAG TPA: TatD family hydrolase [Thermoplasmata archaeon]|nr:TatD family hydrolase [Thermoplasmata archaeon]
MPLPPDLPLVDHHCHLSPTGEGVEAARRFRRAGGTHLFLATQNYTRIPPTRLETYRDQFATTEELARRVASEAGVIAHPVVAPFPVDLVQAESGLGLRAATELHLAALDLAGREVSEHRAVALGEVGRPHFPVPASVAEACESVFIHALEVGRDVGCPVVVHSEDLDAGGYRALAHLASRVGFPLGKLVKHYARTVASPEVRMGVVPSYLARKETAAASLEFPGPWFWETDFLDDPSRPGAVLDLATIPRRATALAGDPHAVERLWVPFVESIQKVYGFTPTASKAAAA